MSDWRDILQVIDLDFNDENLLQQAFVHSSYTNENANYPLGDNERLEFLGDAILSLVVAEELYHKFPQFGEGELTEIRVSLIRQETLATIANQLKIGDYLLLGRGEEATGGRQKQTNLADAFEALIGAIYLDHGLDITKLFILNRLAAYLDNINVKGVERNYKALLQEYMQAEFKRLPLYRTTEASGPEHDKRFVVEVMLDSKTLGSGVGKTKRAAEMEAARHAWETLTRQ